jgi:hypothetical protein
MKTLFKIFVILAVAVLFGGLFYGIVTTISSGADQSSMSERPTGREFPANGEFAPPENDDAGGLQFPFDAFKNLVIISVVSVIYLKTTKWLGRKSPSASFPA